MAWSLLIVRKRRTSRIHLAASAARRLAATIFLASHGRAFRCRGKGKSLPWPTLSSLRWPRVGRRLPTLRRPLRLKATCANVGVQAASRDVSQDVTREPAASLSVRQRLHRAKNVAVPNSRRSCLRRIMPAVASG